MQILTQQIWEGSGWQCVFLTSTQKIPMLLAHRAPTWNSKALFMTGRINFWQFWCLGANFPQNSRKKNSVQKNPRTYHGDNPRSYRSLTTVLLHGSQLPKCPSIFAVAVQTRSPKSCQSPQSIKAPTLLHDWRSHWEAQKSLHFLPSTQHQGARPQRGALWKRTLLFLLKTDCSLSMCICFSFTQIFQQCRPCIT